MNTSVKRRRVANRVLGFLDFIGMAWSTFGSPNGGTENIILYRGDGQGWVEAGCRSWLGARPARAVRAGSKQEGGQANADNRLLLFHLDIGKYSSTEICQYSDRSDSDHTLSGGEDSPINPKGRLFFGVDTSVILYLHPSCRIVIVLAEIMRLRFATQPHATESFVVKKK